MAKNKTHSEVEHLRGENRLLRKQLQKVEGRLRKVIKNTDLEAVQTILEEQPVDITKKGDECPECGKSIEPIDLNNRIIINCVECGHRKVIKK